MLEVDIQDFYDSEETLDFSNSIANSGCNDIAKITWNNALEHEPLLKTPEQIQAAREYFGHLVSEWKSSTDNEIQALFIQEISSQINEWEMFANWEEYKEAEEEGRASGLLFLHNDRMHVQLCF